MQVISSDAKEINLSVKGTDVGILYIIQHELLKASNTNFAGVIVKHPLTNECWIRVNSNTRPVEQIIKAANSAADTVNEFKQLFNSTIKEEE